MLDLLIDRDFAPYPSRSDFDLVGIDNVAGGYMLAEHLLKLCCRHLHFVASPFSAPTVDARIAGVREALLLTTARQPWREIAVTAFHAILERQAEPSLPPRHMMVMPRLVIRDSSGARHD